MTASPASGGNVALCGRPHKACRRKRDGTRPEYDLFAAASEGCLKCVRYYVERAGIAHDARSENNGYTALAFAEWAQDRTDTRAVQDYLRQRQEHVTGTVDTTQALRGGNAAQGLVPTDIPAYVGSCDPSRHVSREQGSPPTPMDMFLGAAYDGCMDCTKFWVEIGHLSPMSRQSRYSAIEWAQFGADEGMQEGEPSRLQRCSRVLGYLETRASDERLPPVTERETQRLYTLGAQMLQRGAATLPQRSAASPLTETPQLPESRTIPATPPEERRPSLRPLNHHRAQSRAPGDTTGLGYSQGSARGRGRHTRRGASQPARPTTTTRWVPRVLPE